MFDFKRNTTPTLEVIIGLPYEHVKSVEFVFKRTPDPTARALVHKMFEKDEGEGIPVAKGKTEKEFTVLLKLKAEETMKLCAGDAYMDTRIVLDDGDVPDTEMQQGRVRETLFGEGVKK